LELAPGTAASGVCWEDVGLAAVSCGSALAHPGRSATRRKKKVWEGALGAFPSIPPLLTARVGAGGTELDRGIVQEYGYSPRASQHSDLHSESRFARFFSASVRRNACKSLKFEFLKFSTLGAQHMSQGFQSYFCTGETTGFCKKFIFENRVWSLFQIQSLIDV
jgi:hypothetical protein